MKQSMGKILMVKAAKNQLWRHEHLQSINFLVASTAEWKNSDKKLYNDTHTHSQHTRFGSKRNSFKQCLTSDINILRKHTFQDMKMMTKWKANKNCFAVRQKFTAFYIQYVTEHKFCLTGFLLSPVCIIFFFSWQAVTGE